MRVDKKSICDKKSSIYQLIVPIIIKDELKIDYIEIMNKKGFEKQEKVENDVNDLLYLDIIEDTYEQGFDIYVNKPKNSKFIINSKRNKEIKQYLKFNVIECSFMFDKNSRKYSNKDKIFLTLLLEDIETENKDIPKEKILTILSEFHNPQINTFGSMIVNEKDETYFLHGDFSTPYGMPNRFINLLDYFEENAFMKFKMEYDSTADQKNKELLKGNIKEISKNINFPFGKNIFIMYYESDGNHFDNLVKAIKKEWKEESKKEEFSKEEAMTLVSNIYETKSYFNIEISNYDELIKDCFYLKWIKNNSIFVTTPNTFGVVVKKNSNNEESVLDPSIIFTKYSLAVFFALNQRILILDLQDSIKGIKYNNYEKLNDYYRYIEQYVFYEISPEIQLQKLYNMIQNHMNNIELMNVINSEIEISQNRRLNEIFKKFTMYGLYLAVLAIVLSIPSYFSTFYSISDEYGNVYIKISKIFANPFVILIIALICYIIAVKYLNNKTKK